MGAWVAFDWETITGFRRHHLPHVMQAGAVYFLTFRLNDSIPASRLALWKRRMEQWLASNPPPHNPAQREMLKVLGFRRIEKYLSGGHGNCLLRQAKCRQILEATLRHDDGQEYELGDFAIMPNHVHVIFKALGTGEMSAIVGAWKSVSAHRIGSTSCWDAKARCGRMSGSITSSGRRRRWIACGSTFATTRAICR